MGGLGHGSGLKGGGVLDTGQAHKREVLDTGQDKTWVLDKGQAKKGGSLRRHIHVLDIFVSGLPPRV